VSCTRCSLRAYISGMTALTCIALQLGFLESTMRGFLMIPQEKERLKAEKEEVEKQYKTAKVDGRVEQVQWTASAHLLFRQPYAFILA
jgi:hypothetical protein